MKAIPFEDANVNVAESQDEYSTLPALKFKDGHGSVITCYSLSFSERLRILFTGRIWMTEMTFWQPVTPRRFSTKRTDVYSKPGDK